VSQWSNGLKLVATGITKSWGPTRVLRGVNLVAEPGSLTALIGANGTGKTTLIRVLATILRPEAGSVMLGDLDMRAQPLKARALLGYLGHESMLDAALSTRENLLLFGSLYGLKNPRDRAKSLIERFEAAGFADLPVAELSRGQEQTAALCRALVHEPRLLLLDEPSTGLDQQARKRLWTAAKEWADRGATVIFSTHDHQAAKEVADRVLEIADGKIV
jgi:ABC-type multidrug transport system ATPase subunit